MRQTTMNPETDDLKAIRNQLGSLIAEMEELNACFKVAAESIAKTNSSIADSTSYISMWSWILGILVLLSALTRLVTALQ